MQSGHNGPRHGSIDRERPNGMTTTPWAHVKATRLTPEEIDRVAQWAEIMGRQFLQPVAKFQAAVQTASNAIADFGRSIERAMIETTACLQTSSGAVHIVTGVAAAVMPPKTQLKLPAVCGRAVTGEITTSHRVSCRRCWRRWSP